MTFEDARVQDPQVEELSAVRAKRETLGHSEVPHGVTKRKTGLHKGESTPTPGNVSGFFFFFDPSNNYRQAEKDIESLFRRQVREKGLE